MRFKYYLRGLGLGILSATLVLMISFHIHDKEVTDTDVIIRARELGMIYPEEASQGEESQNEKENLSTEPRSEETESAPDTQGRDTPPAEAEKPGQENPAEPEGDVPTTAQSEPGSAQGEPVVGTSEATPPENPVPESVTITVEPGDYCRQIAEKLAAQGAIQDPEDFMKYMGEKDLDNNIPNGTFVIPWGADYETISQILNTRP